MSRKAAAPRAAPAQSRQAAEPEHVRVGAEIVETSRPMPAAFDGQAISAEVVQEAIDYFAMGYRPSMVQRKLLHKGVDLNLLNFIRDTFRDEITAARRSIVEHVLTRGAGDIQTRLARLNMHADEIEGMAQSSPEWSREWRQTLTDIKTEIADSGLPRPLPPGDPYVSFVRGLAEAVQESDGQKKLEAGHSGPSGQTPREEG
jgi:hypothetical protein